MLTVIDFKKRESSEGKEFIALIVEGGIEMVRSESTGNYYATSRKASISSTFSELTAQNMIGTSIPGDIKKVACEPYEYRIPETDEIIMLHHRYEYIPELSESQRKIFANQSQPVEKEMVANPEFFSANEEPATI